MQAIARCVDDLKPTRNNAEDPVLVASLDQEHDLLYKVSGNSSVHQRFISMLESLALILPLFFHIKCCVL